jgi:hypothetical protein
VRVRSRVRMYGYIYFQPQPTPCGMYCKYRNRLSIASPIQTEHSLISMGGRSPPHFFRISLAAADKGDRVSKGYWEIIACAIISWKQHRRRLLRLHCKKARIIDNVALTRWWKISDLYTEQGTWSFFIIFDRILWSLEYKDGLLFYSKIRMHITSSDALRLWKTERILL